MLRPALPKRSEVDTARPPFYLNQIQRMKIANIILSSTLALSATTLHAAPTAKQILERQGSGETNCSDDERGTVTEMKLLSAVEAKKFSRGEMETTPAAKYLLMISTLSPAAAMNSGEKTSWSLQEVDAGSKLDDFKPMLGIPSCHYFG